MGDGGDATHDDGPPPKRPRASAEDDDCPGAGVVTRANESEAGASVGAPAGADAGETTATLRADGEGTTAAVMEHNQLPAKENLYSSATVGGLVAGVDGQPPGPISEPCQAPVGDSNEVEK